eukprot:768072-Hanusia_phi.AAC.3
MLDQLLDGFVFRSNRLLGLSPSQCTPTAPHAQGREGGGGGGGGGGEGAAKIHLERRIVQTQSEH